MPIKTFRGLMKDTGDGSQRTIRLSTNKGLIGYRIKKFEGIAYHPSGDDVEGIFKIYSIKPSYSGSTLGTQYIDFDDPTLLAALYVVNYSNPAYAGDTLVVNDNVIVNQDIYLTFSSKHTGNDPANYYIELEQVKLSVDEAAVATLKDMRGTN